MAPLSVDPAALSEAGAAVITAGDAVAAVTSALSSGFGANTGQDSAGEAFALSYQDSAKSLLHAAAASINAYRTVGFKLELGASNYSRAEASSTLGSGGGVLPTPTAPGTFDAPGAPWTLGPGVAEPALWALVEEFVGDLWPNGNPGQIHAAATCWRNFESAIQHAKAALQQPYSTITAQHIPEGQLIQQTFSQLGDAMAKVGDECGKLAKGLDDFASEVQHSQDAIRDLLHRLDTPSGLLHEVVEVFKGHGLDEIRKIADDIRAVLHNMKREADAKEQLFQRAEGFMDSCAVRLEAFAKKELTHFLGNTVGTAASTYFDAEVDIGEGLVKGAADTAHSLSQLNPLRFAYDPHGALESWQGIEKLAKLAANPAAAPVILASDPKGTLDMIKGLDDFKDWSSDRPLVGLGHNLFDVGTAVVPGLGEVGAGTKAAEAAGAATRAADAADVASSVARDGRLIDEAGEFANVTGSMGEVSGAARGLTADLDKIGSDFLKSDSPPGSPTSLPPPKPGEPAGATPPSPVESAPTPSARPDTAGQPRDGISGPLEADHPTTPASPGGALAAPGSPTTGGTHQPVPEAAGPDSRTFVSVPAEPHLTNGPPALGESTAPGQGRMLEQPATLPAEAPLGQDGNPGLGGSLSGDGHPGARPAEGHSPTSDRAHGGKEHDGPPSHSEQPSHHGPGVQQDHDEPYDRPPPLHRDDPLPTKGMGDDYRGENNLNDPNRWCRRLNNSVVKYMSPEELEAARLFVMDGRLHYALDGKPFDTGGGTTVWNRGRGIYVMDEHGNLYVSLDQQVGKLHHSSFFGGKPVAGAGEIEAENGFLKLINRSSGHYQPTEDELLRVGEILKEQGIDITQIIFGGFS